jgi:hypothetical protein
LVRDIAAVSAVGDQGGSLSQNVGVLGLLAAGGIPLRDLCGRMHVG